MSAPARPNIYKLLEQEFKVYDILLDVGCGELNDLVDFEISPFKKLTGFAKDFEEVPWKYHRLRESEKFNLSSVESTKYRKDFFEIYKSRYQIFKQDLLTYEYGININSFIICNKVLHFFNDTLKFELIDKFYHSLQQNGLLYLKLNHYTHPCDTNLNLMIKKTDNIYESKNNSNYIKYLIRPNTFLNSLSKYKILNNYTHINENNMTVVIKK